MYKHVNFTVWDVGGQTKIRSLWHYFENSDALIYVVDCQDRVRFGEAREEFVSVLADDRLRSASLLVFSNQTDMPGAPTTAEVTSKLGLQARRERDWYIQASCAATGEGGGRRGERVVS